MGDFIVLDPDPHSPNLVIKPDPHPWIILMATKIMTVFRKVKRKIEKNIPPPLLDSGVPDKLLPEDPLPPGVLSPTS